MTLFTMSRWECSMMSNGCVLLSLSGPPAVSWLIVSLVVNAIKAKLDAGPLTHVGQEVPIRAIGIQATVLHGVPASVC